MKQSPAFTIIEVAIVLVVVFVVGAAIQLGKEFIDSAENLSNLNQTDNDWDGSIASNSENGSNANEATPVCSSDTDTVDTSSVIGEVIHIFDTSGSHQLDCSQAVEAQILVVAGGGAGGSGGGGGAGAGGLIYDTVSFTETIYDIEVGTGGSPGSSYGGNGGSSSIIGGAYNIEAYGGAGGTPKYYKNPKSGGSGAGTGADACIRSGGAATQGIGATAYGNKGADSTGCSKRGGGGGGGAGTEGVISVGSTGGAGGDGMEIDITGTAIYYAGGGGGAHHNYNSGGAGGLGGGGHGGPSTLITAGTDGLGGGGGGGRYTGAAGGSGVVIVRYAPE